MSPKARERLLSDYAEEWLAHRKGRGGRPLAPRTQANYADLLRLHINGDDAAAAAGRPLPRPRLGRMQLGAITDDDVRRWHTHRLANTGETQVRQAYSLLRAIFNTAVADGLMPKNHCTIRGAGQANAPERGLLEYADVRAFADAIAPYLRTAVLVAFDAHLRLGELLAVQRRDIDLTAATMRVRRQVVSVKVNGVYQLVETEPKAGSTRTVSLANWCTPLIAEHLAAAGPGLPSARLFTRPDGAELRHHHVQNAWARARNDVDVTIRWANVHDLRAAGLTLVAQLGATVRETQARAGHSTAAAAMIYQRASRSRDRIIADLLSAHAAAEDAKGTGTGTGSTV